MRRVMHEYVLEYEALSVCLGFGVGQVPKHSAGSSMEAKALLF